MNSSYNRGPMKFATRLPAVDLLKVVAAQCIVLHHFSAYGPLSDALATAVPALISWLYDNARMAVQVFLVIGGFLAARSLAKHPITTLPELARITLQRHLRLALPFAGALIIAIISAMLARQWMDDPFIPDAPTWRQFISHLFFAQGVLGHEALTAGAWYVAIDFQLFATLAALAWLGTRLHRASSFPFMLLLTILTGLSLFWFNTLPALDNWAPYFFGAYGLGVAAWWASQGEKRWFTLISLLAILALALEFRWRLSIALMVAAFLSLMDRLPTRILHTPFPVIHALGQRAYALFLVHFPVLMLVNACFAEWNLAGPWAGAAGCLTFWCFSMLGAHAFHAYVELPASRFHPGHLFDRCRSVWLGRLQYRIATTGLLVLAIPV